MAAFEELHAPEPAMHFSRLHVAEESKLTRDIAAYFYAGLTQGAVGILMTTAEHRIGIYAHLEAMGVDMRSAVEKSQVLFFDAGEMLQTFMVNGYPDQEYFEKSINSVMGETLSRAPHFFIYGEMVHLLWKERRYAAAVRVEQLWNRLQRKSNCISLSIYPIDIFDIRIEDSMLTSIVHVQTYCTKGENEQFEIALRRVMEEASGAGISCTIPAPASLILWMKNNGVEAERICVPRRVISEKGVFLEATGNVFSRDGKDNA